MILKNLRIEAFRGMKDVVFDELAPLTIVVGSNNAGKSSALEAASVLLRPLDPAQWVQVARQRDVDTDFVDGLWSLFPTETPLYLEDGPAQTQELAVSGLVEGADRSLRASGLASVGIGRESEEELVLRIEARVHEGGGSHPHTMEFRNGFPATMGQGVFLHRCFTVTPATHRSTRVLVGHLSQAIDMGHKHLAVELLQLFDNEVHDLDVSTSRGRDSVRVTHKTRGVVDLASFGDGMRRATALALALARAKKGLLLIDEIETGIHPTILPTVLEKLLEAAGKADVQILATTHSIEAIDALLSATTDVPESAVAFYVHRKGDEHLVRRYDRPTLVSHREVGLDLR